jgi:hypothetical protein
MKGLTEAARAVCLDCAFSLDMARAGAEDAKAWQARGAFLTPIAKAFGTDVGNAVAYIGVQVHGGMGFVEETGAAQYSRDVRVTAIYEGTNGIQALDLVGRKLGDGGETARALLAEIRAEAEAATGKLAEPGARLAEAADALAAATDWMLEAEMNARAAGAVDYEKAWGMILGGAYLLKGARLAEPHEANRRAGLARAYAGRELPEAIAHARAAQGGDEVLYLLSAEELAS